ncbi:MAG: hypothetical protein ACXVUE_11985 [Solirubrobacteraceae bacterium]
MGAALVSAGSATGRARRCNGTGRRALAARATTGGAGRRSLGPLFDSAVFGSPRALSGAAGGGGAEMVLRASWTVPSGSGAGMLDAAETGSGGSTCRGEDSGEETVGAAGGGSSAAGGSGATLGTAGVASSRTSRGLRAIRIARWGAGGGLGRSGAFGVADC